MPSSLAIRLLRRMPVSLLLLLLPALSQAAYLPQGDPVLRHDLQLLADHGVITTPVTTWPLPANAVRDLAYHKAEDQPASVQRARRRVLNRTHRLQGLGIAAGATVAYAPEPLQLRTFAETPRETAELAVATEDDPGSGAYRLEVTGALDAEDDRPFRLDGSYAALRLGNWLLSASAQPRWWGPGWDGSLILSNNARPVPMIALERDNPTEVDLPLLRWLGPLRFTTFLGQLESGRAVPRTKFFGMRIAFRPAQAVEIGLSRTAQWGGKGRPEDRDSFEDMLAGRSNLGDTDTDEAGGDANQLAGFDIRWASPLGDGPYAVYGQFIGEDEAGNFPYRYIGLAGLEVWGAWGTSDYRLHLEAADTTAEFQKSDPNYNVAYEHSGYRDGYRYYQRSLGHAMDGDGRMLSLGLHVVVENDAHWRVLIRRTELNRDGERRRPGISPREATLTGLDVAYAFRWRNTQVSLGAGADHRDRPGRDSDMDSRAWLSISRPLP